jgi:hypothetical protein
MYMNLKQKRHCEHDNESQQTHDHDTLAEFFVIVQTCVFSSLATTKNDTYSYCIFGFKGNDYLPLKFASVSFYCQVSDTGSVG